MRTTKTWSNTGTVALGDEVALGIGAGLGDALEAGVGGLEGLEVLPEACDGVGEGEAPGERDPVVGVAWGDALGSVDELGEGFVEGSGVSIGWWTAARAVDRLTVREWMYAANAPAPTTMTTVTPTVAAIKDLDLAKRRMSSSIFGIVRHCFVDMSFAQAVTPRTIAATNSCETL